MWTSCLQLPPASFSRARLARPISDIWKDVGRSAEGLPSLSPVIRRGKQQARWRAGAGACERSRGSAHEPIVYAERNRQDEDHHSFPRQPSDQHHQRPAHSTRWKTASTTSKIKHAWTTCGSTRWRKSRLKLWFTTLPSLSQGTWLKKWRMCCFICQWKNWMYSCWKQISCHWKCFRMCYGRVEYQKDEKCHCQLQVYNSRCQYRRFLWILRIYS